MDGCDISKGLGESISGKWSGDVDLNDGSLEQQYAAYKDRLAFVDGLALGDHNSMMCIENDLSTIKKEMDADIVFITAGDYLNVLYMYMYK